MALAELLLTLEADADARIAALLTDARADAERLGADGAAELGRRRSVAVGTREIELRAGLGRALEAARRQAAGTTLEARAAALERIRVRAEAMLAERAADPALLGLFVRDLALALEYVGPVPATVEAPGALIETLRAGAAARDRVTFATSDPERAGLIVRSADGSVTVDATLGSRLARAWPRLAIHLAARLEAPT